MSGPVEDKEELMLSLDKLLAKYFQERDGSSAEKTSLHKFWGTYLRAMKDEDEARPRDWDGNTGNILTFTGLFAATVAAFLIEGYKMLSPDSGDQTVVLLTQLLAVTTNSSSNPTPGPLSPATFHAPLPAVLANALWFCSLVVALACALLATLVQQWSRDYVRDIKQRETLDETFVSRALNHVYIRMGVDRYGMDGVVYVIVALVHLAVILFAAGLLLFLYPINAAVAGCTSFSLGIFGSVYLIASITPIRDTSCPYRTPLTYPCALGYSIYQYARPCAGSLAHFTRLQRLVHWVSLTQHFAANLTPTRRIEKYWARLTSSRRFEPPDVPRKLEIIPTARRETRYVADTMSLPRFKFVWRRTSRHLVNVDADSLNILLQSTLHILHSMPSDEGTRFECLDYLLSDKVLASRLDEIGRLRPGSPDSDTCVATLKMACLLLRRTYTKQDMWSAHNDHSRRILAYHLSALFSMIRSSEEVCHDALTFNLQARLCLFHLRWSLLLLVREVSSRTGSSLDLARFNELYFSNEKRSDDVLSLSLNHELLDQPKALLLLLNSWQYNHLDAIEPHSSHNDWDTDTSPCLVPLHDDVCCRRRDGPCEHIAACTILTMIAHIIRASEPESDELRENHLWEYGQLWDHGPTPFDEWEHDFAMSEGDRNRTPSLKFLAVLRDAGLDRWMEAGDDLTYLPPLDTPHGRLLAYSDGMFAKALRILVRHVDMGQAHSDLLQDLRWRVHAPSTPPDAGRDEVEKQNHLEDGAAQPRAPRDTECSSEAAQLNIYPGRRRGDSFDLEQVVVDTAVGRESSASSQLFLTRTAASGGMAEARTSASSGDAIGYDHEH